MVQGRCCAGFEHEPAQPLRVLYEVLRQNLKGDGPVELSITGLVHLAHSAFTDLLKNLVVCNSARHAKSSRCNLDLGSELIQFPVTASGAQPAFLEEMIGQWRRVCHMKDRER